MARRDKTGPDNGLVLKVAVKAIRARDRDERAAGALIRSASTLASLVPEDDRDDVTALLARIEVD